MKDPTATARTVSEPMKRKSIPISPIARRSKLSATFDRQ
jgi:hypothetical protein